MDHDFNKKMTEQLQHDLTQNAIEAFKHCLKLWTQIGYTPNEILNRCTEVSAYFKQSYDDLMHTEEFILKNIQDNLIAYKKELKHLQQALNVQLVKLNDANNNSTGRNCDAVDSKNSQENCLKNKTMLEETEYYKKMIKELSKIKSERKNKLNDLKKREKVLCDILNESQYSILNTSYVDQAELENFEYHVNNLSLEKQKRISQLKQFCEDISSLVNEYKLKIEPDSSIYHLISLRHLDSFELTNKIISNDIQLDHYNFERYRNSIGRLNFQKEQLIESIDMLRMDIINMWNKFELKNSDLEDCILNTPAYTQETYETLFDEYTRCVSLKKSKTEDLIKEKVCEIFNLVDLCMLGEDIKDDIELKTRDAGYSEEMLEHYQTYLDNLQEYAIKYEKLFKLLKEWTDTWQQFKEFEMAHMDPNRFHQRGYSSLNEQRERDSFKNKLNKLTQQLKSENDVYVRNERKDFVVNGMSIEGYMDALKEEFEREKEKIREERKIGTNSLRKKSVVRNFLTPQNQNTRSSFAQKSLVSTQSPSSPGLNRIKSAKYSITSQTSAKSTSSIRLNFDATPNSSKIIKSTPRKLLNPFYVNEKKKPSISTFATLPQKHKRRSSIKDMSEKYRKNQRRSKIPFEGKVLSYPVSIPEIVVSKVYDFQSFQNSRCDFLKNENDSILKSANMYACESTHLTSSGVGSGYSSISGHSQ